MGWFNKDKKEEAHSTNEMPKLPELPKLPDLPNINSKKKNVPEPPRTLNKLPSYPNNNLGERFSQNTIKEAVAGKKEVDRGYVEDDEDERPMMHTPPQKVLRKEIDEDEEEREMTPTRPITKITHVPAEFQEAHRIVKRAEPIFIRLDKFEDSLKIFEKAKTQINEIEKLLRDITRIREEEEKELESWEKETQNIKDKIARVDNDLFSMLD